MITEEEPRAKSQERRKMKYESRFTIHDLTDNQTWNKKYTKVAT
ncbi:MAG: hypothetical protein V7655_00525 [Aequorivita antarctica]